MEDADFQHGVFMHYLLEGLQGQAANSDGAVTLAGLYDFASLQTKKYVTRKFNDSQTPALKGEINGPFEICRRITPKVEREKLPAETKSGLRTWTDVTGRHTIQAEFHGVVGGYVKLRNADGKEVSLPLEKLSDEDQQWIRSHE